jgi:hypothetical protein
MIHHAPFWIGLGIGFILGNLFLFWLIGLLSMAAERRNQHEPDRPLSH